MAAFLDVTDRVCPAVAGYRFANVIQLDRDFKAGRFADAFPLRGPEPAGAASPRQRPPTKTYTGYRRPGPHGTAFAEAAIVTVHEEGKAPRPLDPRFDLRRHSDALNWGYGGSGAAQLALALAADLLGAEHAQKCYQALKRKVVAGLAQDGWTLTEGQLRAALDQIQRDDERRGR